MDVKMENGFIQTEDLKEVLSYEYRCVKALDGITIDIPRGLLQ
jgi:hypothetical protein